MIHIIMSVENENSHWDENVTVEFSLPCIPNVGDVVHISNELELELEEKAVKSPTMEDYLDKWEYRDGISFSDAVFVKHIKYKSNENKVYIAMGSYDY